MRLLRPDDKPTNRVVFVQWETRDAYDAYKKSEVFRKTHAGVNPAWFMGPPKVERFEEIFAL